MSKRLVLPALVSLWPLMSSASAQSWNTHRQCEPADVQSSTEVRQCEVWMIGTESVCRCIIVPGVSPDRAGQRAETPHPDKPRPPSIGAKDG